MLDADTGAAGQSALVPVRFDVTIDGHSLAVFSELVGISSSVDVVDAISASPTETIGTAGTSGVLMETVTLTCDFVQRVSV